MSLFHFDATEVPTLGDRTPIPLGDYNVLAVEVEQKPTADDPQYSYLAFTFEVIDGPHTGFRIFENLSLWNKNPTAVDIAARTLSSICHATGILVFDDPAQLLNRPMKAHVKIAPGRPNKDPTKPPYEPSNKITSYGTYEGPIGGAGVGATAAPALARPVAAPAAPARPAAPMAPAPAPSIPTAPAAPIPPPFAVPMAPSAAPVVPEDETPVWARSK